MIPAHVAAHIRALIEADLRTNAAARAAWIEAARKAKEPKDTSVRKDAA